MTSREEWHKLLGIEDDGQEVLDRRYRAIGGAKELFQCEDLEVLIESGAGTGKSYSLMRKGDWLARNNPGMRILFCRKTRKSMNESILRDFESKVLWPEHPAMQASTASLEQKNTYPYDNGAVIVLGGLDNVDRIMSTQYDFVAVYEATEVTLEDWEKLLSRMRNNKGPYHQMVADCNPAAKHHWLNKRFPELQEGETTARKGVRCRIGYRHEDNPLWYNNELGVWTQEGQRYIRDVLGSLTGHRRARLLEHLWVSAEGLVWPEWDDDIHIIDASDAPPMEWYFASKDFGFRNPGCLHVWGVADGRMYCVAEVYAKEKDLDWWAVWAEELFHQYKYTPGVADSAEPRSIKHLNDRVGSYMGRSGSGVWIPSDKTKGKLHGLNMVRWGLQQDAQNKPRIMFLDDCQRYRDPELVRAYQPTSVVEEIPGYTFKEETDGRQPVEQSDPSCPDHGCDSLCYGSVWFWKKERNQVKKKPTYPEGSFGAMLPSHNRKKRRK